ncbi:unnamed protein product [Brassica rapa]|uniref:CoA carboxyltransferase N-terminal domain-containing protein n=1 Tax=Brassica campestris TaxID=3711 RepID=A0A8D9GRA3_BRACM|nr:unnamed protein product [Brassica rapa]
MVMALEKLATMVDGGGRGRNRNSGGIEGKRRKVNGSDVKFYLSVCPTKVQLLLKCQRARLSKNNIHKRKKYSGHHKSENGFERTKMLRLLGRRGVSASQELTSVHQWRIRTDSKPDPFRIFRGLLQKGFCVGVLPDGVDRKSEAFSSNAIAMEGILSELRTHITKVLAGGGEEAVKRNRSRNKLLPRERIDKLLDPGSSFLELSQVCIREKS